MPELQLWIAGLELPSPADYKLGRFDISKAERSARGKMVIEIIATKTRIDSVWKMLPDDELEWMLDLINQYKPSIPLTYVDAGKLSTMICYNGDIEAALWHTINGVRYWEQVSIPFIER